VDGKIVGSELIVRTSQAELLPWKTMAVNYAGNGSGASNFGPTNKNLMEQVSQKNFGGQNRKQPVQQCNGASELVSLREAALTRI